MALNDVYEITLKQRMGGQDIINVFHVHQVLAFVTTFPTVAQVVAEGFQTQVLNLITTWQSAECVSQEIDVRNLFDDSDRFTLFIAVPGSAPASADTLPQFNAVAFSLGGDNGSVRSGSKRFAGLTEVTQVDGVITDPTLTVQLNNLANKLEGYITVGTLIPDNVFRFVIVKRIRTGSPGNYQYRLPENQLESVLSAVIVAVFNALISSQVSRKIGRGV